MPRDEPQRFVLRGNQRAHFRSHSSWRVCQLANHSVKVGAILKVARLPRLPERARTLQLVPQPMTEPMRKETPESGEPPADQVRADGEARPRARPSTLLQTGVFLTVLFGYLLGEGRTPPYNDSRQIYTVAETIVYEGSIGYSVPGGKLYAQQAFLTSAIHLPGVAVRRFLAKTNPSLDRLIKPMTSHFGSQVACAIGCLVLFRLLAYLGLSLLAASLGTFAFAFGSFLPIYARSAWSEGLQAACFMGFYSALLRVKGEPGRRTGLWFGLWLGLLINCKYVFVLVLPGAVLFLAYHAWQRRQWKSVLAAAAWSMVPGAFLAAVILWYNWARTGASTNSGYPTVAGLAQSVFREHLLFGLWAYFFSYGKSLFLYVPPLVLSVLAIPLVLRRNRDVLWALLLTASPVVYLYSKFVYWSGDWCWGPRYVLFLVGPMLVPAAFFIDRCVRERRRIASFLCAVVLALGVLVQVVGASQYWDAYIRVSRGIQSRWLGSPNRSGALTADRGGTCDPCFEDFYARNFTPALQPIEAQWWILKHRALSHPWAVAAEDTPVRRYTTLDFPDLERWYQHPPWDWWKLDFVGPYKSAGTILLAIFLSGFAAGLLLWGRGVLSVGKAVAQASGPGRRWSGLRTIFARCFARCFARWPSRLRDRIRRRPN
jgi:hypothetical protein